MKQRCVIDKEMGIAQAQVKLLFVLPYLIGITHHVTAGLDRKSNVDEHPEKLSNSNQNLGIDIPSDRRATSLDDLGDTIDNAEEPLEKIGNMFENRKILFAAEFAAEKHERSTSPIKLPKIFSWNAAGSVSFTRSLSKSLLDLFEYYFGDVPGLGAPFILWDFFYREVLQGN